MPFRHRSLSPSVVRVLVVAMLASLLPGCAMPVDDDAIAAPAALRRGRDRSEARARPWGPTDWRSLRRRSHGGWDPPILAAGPAHFCSLSSAGDVDCWGATAATLPAGSYEGVAIGGMEVSVHSSDSTGYVCGVRSADHHVECDGVVPSLDVAVHGLAAGPRFACALRDADGRPECWGPSALAGPDEELTQVVVGLGFACGLRAVDGSVTCWGATVDVPAGVFTSLVIQPIVGTVCGLTADGEPICGGKTSPSLPHALPPADARFSSLAFGANYGCGVVFGTTDLVCWGALDRGWWDPVETTLGYNRATRVPDGLRAQSVVASFDHTCVVRADDGGITCFGSLLGGEGRPDGDASFARLVFGQTNACALTTEGNLHCWLENASGSPRAISPEAYVAPEGLRFSDVSYGYSHACGVARETGEATCFGTDRWFLPDGAGMLDAPAGVAFDDVAVHNAQSCGIRRADGQIQCWGASGTRTEYPADYDPPAGAFDRIYGGVVHMCALRADGTAACWGDAQYGACDPPPDAFDMLSVGTHYGCGLRSEDGHLRCWGENGPSVSSAPTDVAFTQISVGFGHGCGLVEGTGEVLCWGSSPGAEVPAGLPTLREVAVTGDSTCGIRADDDSEVCWGRFRRHLPR
ncbi:MAG: hypothetical protein H6719_20180 [Sandaracinaceae bacterium]|nr:hypothetical protein [Sandaracinaceae bacterium]